MESKRNDEKKQNMLYYLEGQYYVSRCLNVNASSFGESIDEAKMNLQEAAGLYFENENFEMQSIDDTAPGR